jgi:hypothetical protein
MPGVGLHAGVQSSLAPQRVGLPEWKPTFELLTQKINIRDPFRNGPTQWVRPSRNGKTYSKQAPHSGMHRPIPNDALAHRNGKSLLLMQKPIANRRVGALGGF